MLSSCQDCGLGFAEIDGVCSFCRALFRFTAEAKRLPVALRSWATDQTRVWLAILQEEAYKFRVAEESRQAQESATPKAAAPTPEGAGRPPQQGGVPPPVPEIEAKGGEIEVKQEGEEDPPKPEGVASPVVPGRAPKTNISLSDEPEEEEEETPEPPTPPKKEKEKKSKEEKTRVSEE